LLNNPKTARTADTRHGKKKGLQCNTCIISK